MRIGIDCRLWNETGVGRYIRNLVIQLNTLDDQHTYYLFVRPEDTQAVKDALENKRWKLIPVTIHWHSIQEQVLFPGILNKYKLDLMHFPYFSVPLLYNRPFIVTVHDLIIYHYPTGKATTLPYPVYRLKHKAYTQVVSSAVKRAKQIIVPLQLVKEDVIQTLKAEESKIYVTPEGVDENLLRSDKQILPMVEADKKYFLYVGNAYPHKNIDTLIKAFVHFIKETGMIQVNLFMVGKEDFFYKQLENKLKEKYVPLIHVFHNIDDRLLKELNKNALAVISPSFMEGFGLVPLEAISQGSLVLASDIPAHREVCADAAVYFDPKRVEDLTFAMVKAATISEEEKQKYLAAGKERRKEFSWQEMAKKTLKVYELNLPLKSIKGTV